MEPRITYTVWVLPVVVLFICGSGDDRLGSVEYSQRSAAAAPTREEAPSSNLVLAGKKKPRRSTTPGASPGAREGAREQIEPQGTGRAVVTATQELVVSKRPLGQRDSFRSIESALDHASTNSLRMIHVTVHPGRYSEDLQITRPTAIDGTDPNGVFVLGSISNPDGHRLTLSNLRMQDCRPYALMQRGGSLTLTDFSVNGTRRTPEDHESGVAIDVAGGVVGRFTNVSLDSNEGAALRVRGSGTGVVAFHLSATNNRIFRPTSSGAKSSRYAASLGIERGGFANPIDDLRPVRIGYLVDDVPARIRTAAAETPGREMKRKKPLLRQAPAGQRLQRSVARNGGPGSAVEVAEGALLLAKNPVIESNEFIGILVRNGGRAHLADGRVTRTRSVPELGDQGGGGHNVSARYRSRVELRNMWIAHGDLTGIQSVESWVKVSGTIVEDNPIGCNLQGSVEPDYDPWECVVLAGTEFRNNERDFDSLSLPVPDPSLPDDWLQGGGGQSSDRQEPNCPGVPWELAP